MNVAKFKPRKQKYRQVDRGIVELSKGQYLVRWSYLGKVHQKTCGTVTEAREIRNSIKTKIHEGKYFDQISTKKVAFDVAVNGFLAFSHDNLRPATIREDERYARRWLHSPIFMGRALQDITTGDIESYKQALGQKRSESSGRQDGRKLSKRTVDVEISRLKRLFRLAVDHDLCVRNPASRVRLHREDNAKNRFLSPEEESRLLKACPENLKAVVVFAINTGLRRGEVTGLLWKDIDLERQQLVIPSFRAKSKRSRNIPLNDTALDVINQRKAGGTPNQFVFPNTAGGRMENLHHQFRKAVVTAGLEDVSFHTLRHTFASRIVAASGGLVEARELLGHRDYQVTLRYVHLTNLQLRNAVKKIG